MRAAPRAASGWPSDAAVDLAVEPALSGQPLDTPGPIRPAAVAADRPVGRLLHKRDFESVLAVPPRSRSAHFAVHHVARAPQGPGRPVVPELSTGSAPERPIPVDDLPPGGLWLGTVVPKRCARRAVTRSLLKRQIRAAVERHAATLAAGLWVVRLRAPFDRNAFPSAASNALRVVARTELDAVLTRAAR